MNIFTILPRTRTILCAVILSANIQPLSAEENDYLTALDRALADIPKAVQHKERQIAGLRNTLAACRTIEDEYNARMELYRAYQSFSLDSALVYINSSLPLALRLGDNERIIDTRLSQAFLYCYAGMYKEASDILSAQDVTSCSPWLRRSYFHLKMTIYDYLSGATLDKQLAAHYRDVADTSRDSILLHAPDDNVLAAERLTAKGDYARAMDLLADSLPDGLTTRDAGIRYYVISEIYGRQNNTGQQKKYLAMAATADLTNAVREYIALRKLAIILYDEGDIKRAYRYIHQCIEDANACNARQRSLEISQILPIIDTAYNTNEETNSERLLLMLILISILSALLIASLCYVGKKMVALRQARQRLSTANTQLQEAYAGQARLNDDLSSLNEELKRANQEQTGLNGKLQESNRIKEEYVMRFMNLCSDYLAKMENYRKELNKIAAQRNFDALYNAVKSTRFINKEIDEFYRNFDNAFLHIFPDFVEQVNRLLLPEEQIVLKADERMNTELRIYALLRLGISDRASVSTFLRCSSSTIYNYRTKMRNKAADRDSFEQNVMLIN